MIKPIHATIIDTAGHGYLSISKKDFSLVCNPSEITHYSGHTFTRIYLEEDCDASLFCGKARDLGYELVVKHSYNPSFAVKHNFKPELFDYQPKVGDTLLLHDGEFQITSQDSSRIIIEGQGRRYKIASTNPYSHIQGVKGFVSSYKKAEQQVKAFFGDIV
jgi:hypothetical protein